MAEGLNEIYQSLGRIEGTLEEMKTHNEFCDRRMIQLTSRVAKMERWKSWVVGISMGVSLVGGATMELVRRKFL